MVGGLRFQYFSDGCGSLPQLFMLRNYNFYVNIFFLLRVSVSSIRFLLGFILFRLSYIHSCIVLYFVIVFSPAVDYKKMNFLKKVLKSQKSVKI